MLILFFAWVALFTFLAFVRTGFSSEIPVSFYNYYSFIGSIITDNPILFPILFILGFLYLMISRTSASKIGGVVLNFQIVLISFLFSGIFVFSVAVIELNILSIVVNLNPHTIGVYTDRQAIIDKLNNSDTAPDIIPSDPDGYELIKKLAISASGSHHYYGKYLLQSIPDGLIKSLKSPVSSLALVDNTLIISFIDEAELQSISKTLAYKTIQNYFSDRKIKSEAEISILPEAKYQEFRTMEMQKKLLKIRDEIITLQIQASHSADLLNTRHQELAEFRSDLEAIYNSREIEHRNCLSEGKYVSGVFQKTNSEAGCREIFDSWSDRITNALNQIRDIEDRIKITKSEISGFDTTLVFISAQQAVIQQLQASIPGEYGAFHPENTIGVAFVPNSPHRILDYLGTLIHEYLHYTSYISEDQILPDAFFEEGLTEYFSRQVIKKHLQNAPNIGYPAFTRIISQISKRIPESELAEIYFSKNQKQLEQTLDRVYGDDFYKQNRILFIALQYASQPAEIVSYANMIMEKIGGPPLTKADIISTSVDL